MGTREKVKSILGTLGFLGIANLFLYPVEKSPQLPVMEEIPLKDIIAPYDFPIPKDLAQLEAERNRAAGAVLPVIQLELEDLPATQRQIARLRSNPDRFLKTHPLLLSSWTKELLTSPRAPRLLDRVEATLRRILSQGYWDGRPPLSDTQLVVIRSGDDELEELVGNLLRPEEVDSLIREEAQRGYPNSKRLQSAFREVAKAFLAPNLRYDSLTTAGRQERARSQVSPNEGWVLRGELIAEAHRPLTPDARKKLLALRSAADLRGISKLHWLVSGNLLLLFLSAGIGYLLRGRVGFRLKEPGGFYFLLLLGAVVLGLSRLSGLWRWELSPVGVAGIAGSVLWGPGVALPLVAGLALMVGYRAGFSLSLCLGLGLGGGLAAILCHRLRSRSRIYYGLLGVAIGNWVGFGISWLIDPTLGGGWLNGLGLSCLNGLASTGVAVLLISISDPWFKVVNPFTLRRFLDLNHPLLQRLALEAPGSYQHSIVVGNLAGAGASSIGADPILAKASGYFHDLGKIHKPGYFLENQAGGDNPHDRLSPQLSVLIIISHVKEGVELARRHRLSCPLQEVIAQHHGTTRIEPFYRKAVRRTGHLPSEYEYRYPGPKPRSQEAALVMLADGVEAAVRSERMASPQHLKKLIKNLVDARYEDGQLDESGLSRVDLLKIQEAFYRVVLSTFHARPRYPQG